MLKEAIEKIEAMTRPVIHQEDGHTYAVYNNGDIFEVQPDVDCVITLNLTSLDALVKMIKHDAIPRELAELPLYITIPSPMQVLCFTGPNNQAHEVRLTLYSADATDVPGWDSMVQMGFEEAMIALRTRFQESADSEYALKLLSDITTGSKVTYNDNGVATSIVTQSGIALQSNQNIRPIISLRPYRTFQEVEQPASQFLIRVSERGIKFVEADGGMWKLDARKTIKAYLEDALADELSDGSVVIAL